MIGKDMDKIKVWIVLQVSKIASKVLVFVEDEKLKNRIFFSVAVLYAFVLLVWGYNSEGDDKTILMTSGVILLLFDIWAAWDLLQQ